MPGSFDLQGHRGARGLKPENTLPSFEVAFDVGVTTIETDVHLTRDGVPVLCHDPAITESLCSLVPGSDSPDPAIRPLVSTLTLEQLRGYRADRNPNPTRFSHQNAAVTPVAQAFADLHGIDPYTLPALADLLGFAEAYVGELGTRVGKTTTQQAGVRRLIFDLELKRVPFRPETIGDNFDGKMPGLLEKRVIEQVRARHVRERTVVRSFDHRCLAALRTFEPNLELAVLIAGTAPVALAELARQVDARTYCPDFEFLDRALVDQAHAAGLLVKAWTVNEPPDWARLLEWGVDGITTDYPDRLAEWLTAAGRTTRVD